jgi:tripeptide aminopeptidase
MKEVFEQEAAAVGATAHVEVIEEYKTYNLTESDPVMRIAATAARAAGLNPVLRPSGGGSDGNVFNGFGFPTTVLACGMEQIHTHEEFCTISALVQDAQWVLEIIRTARDFRE